MSANCNSQPSLDELMSAFLARQASAASAGQELVATGDIEAHEAVPSQSVDPRQSWDGAVETLEWFGLAKAKTRLPSGWTALTNGLPSAISLPMAVGHFPQAVRDLPALLQPGNRDQHPVAKIDDAGLQGSIDSHAASSEPSDWFIAVGLMRLSGRFDEAGQFLAKQAKRLPKELTAAWDNEKAALAWATGQHKQASQIWKSLGESAPVTFNRGVAELFAGSATAACGHFDAAAAKLPESSGWHHLAKLYLAIAESR